MKRIILTVLFIILWYFLLCNTKTKNDWLCQDTLVTKNNTCIGNLCGWQEGHTVRVCHKANDPWSIKATDITECPNKVQITYEEIAPKKN